MGADASTKGGFIWYNSTNAAVTEGMRLDSSGNLGLGVTPSASTIAQFEGGSNLLMVGRGNAYLSNNATFNSSFKYINTAAAGQYNISGAAHSWYTAPSGTAGNAITFTQAMTLDASGQLGVGVTSMAVPSTSRRGLQVSNGTSGGMILLSNSTTESDNPRIFGSVTTQYDLGFSAGGSTGFINWYTNGSERARITSGGYFKASDAGTYASSTGTYHELRSSTSNARTAIVANTASSLPFGILVDYTGAAPNGTGSAFLECQDTGGARFVARSNGGLANYSGNDVNLSDRREKTNFAPAGEYLSKICAIPVQTFNYIDQAEDDPGLTLGVVAQDVQAVAPELVMESNWGTEEEPKMRLSIYQTDLQYALMKCIQEQQAIIEQLKADVAALKGA
jgi:hypothetical protein